MTDSKPNPQNNLSVRQLAKLIKKFHIQDGDILALKQGTSLATHGTIKEIGDAVGRLHTNIVIIVVDSFDDLSVMTETEMNKHGWYRLKTLSKLITREKP